MKYMAAYGLIIDIGVPVTRKIKSSQFNLYDYETTSFSVFTIICILQTPLFIVEKRSVISDQCVGGARIFAVWGSVLAEPRVGGGGQKEGICHWHMSLASSYLGTYGGSWGARVRWDSCPLPPL